MDNPYQNDIMVTFRDLGLATEVEDSSLPNKQLGDIYASVAFNKLFPNDQLNIGPDGFNNSFLRFLNIYEGNDMFNDYMLGFFKITQIIVTTVRRRLYLTKPSGYDPHKINKMLDSFQNMTQLHITISGVPRKGRGKMEDMQLEVIEKNGSLIVRQSYIYSFWNMEKYYAKYYLIK